MGLCTWGVVGLNIGELSIWLSPISVVVFAVLLLFCLLLIVYLWRCRSRPKALQNKNKLHKGRVSENSMNACLPDNVKHRCSVNQVHKYSPTKAWLTVNMPLPCGDLDYEIESSHDGLQVLMDEVH